MDQSSLEQDVRFYAMGWDAAGPGLQWRDTESRERPSPAAVPQYNRIVEEVIPSIRAELEMVSEQDRLEAALNVMTGMLHRQLEPPARRARRVPGRQIPSAEATDR